MFITNFSLNSHTQGFYIILLVIIGIALLLSSYLLINVKISEVLILVAFFLISFLIVLFPAFTPNKYKLTIAYVNIDDNNNKTMTKDVAINTLLNDEIYPKYNLKYKTEKETFKLTKEEYEKLSKIYYDDLNNRR